MSGQLRQTHYFSNSGGLNIADSPFAIKDGECTGGFNFDYSLTGAIAKRSGHTKLNSSPDAQLRTVGIGVYTPASTTESVLRYAGTKVQLVDVSAGTTTNLTEDTVTASSDILGSGTTVPVATQQFNTTTHSVLWGAGGGMTRLYGAYSTTKVTKNGSDIGAGSITPSVGGSGGTFGATGTYRYAVALRKAGTQALSNVWADCSATISGTTQEVTLPLTSLTGIDTTKYDQIWIYRSAVGGAVGFTTGDLIAQLASSATTFTDTGGSVIDDENIPRSGGVVDNSVLDATKTYKTLAVFKRRLVTSYDNIVVLSDVNKPESWPTLNTFTIPAGGKVTGLASISFVTPTSTSIDEILCVFTERKVWVITGDDLNDWTLKFIDDIGCSNQTCIVSANGYVFWLDANGIYLWNGSDKPIKASRMIQPLFQLDGDIDKAKLSYAWGTYFRKNNHVVWGLSHKIVGEQKFQLKLDLRLSLPRVTDQIMGRNMDAVFIPDKTTFALYGGMAYTPASSAEETFIASDSSGYVYRMFSGSNDASGSIEFYHDSKFFDMGDPNTAKRYHKVIVWVEEVGTWDLYVDWWAGYRTSDADKTSLKQPISTAENSAIALWDVAYWDLAYWDDYNPRLRGLVYNLNSTKNNVEGDSLKVRIRQTGADQPVTIVGYTVVWSESGMRK